MEFRVIVKVIPEGKLNRVSIIPSKPMTLTQIDDHIAMLPSSLQVSQIILERIDDNG